MKKLSTNRLLSLFMFFMFLFCAVYTFGQTAVGSGSYTTVYPGADSAGRNGFPSGSPQLSKTAVGKPVPTNDWWSKLVKEDHADNLFNYPMTMKTTNSGLIVTYISSGVIGDNKAIEVGLSGLNASRATVSDYSDWTVSMNWNDGVRDLQATSGIGMPFLYFEKNTGSEVSVKVNSGTASVSNELLIIENASSGADFVVFAPAGSTWSVSGSTYTSTLNGKNYWSMAMLRQWFPGLSEVHAFRCSGSRGTGGHRSAGLWHEEPRRLREGAGARSRVRSACAERCGLPHRQHHGRDADSAQWLPSAQEASGLTSARGLNAGESDGPLYRPETEVSTSRRH